MSWGRFLSHFMGGRAAGAEVSGKNIGGGKGFLKESRRNTEKTEKQQKKVRKKSNRGTAVEPVENTD